MKFQAWLSFYQLVPGRGNLRKPTFSCMRLGSGKSSQLRFTWTAVVGLRILHQRSPFVICPCRSIAWPIEWIGMCSTFQLLPNLFPFAKEEHVNVSSLPAHSTTTLSIQVQRATLDAHRAEDPMVPALRWKVCIWSHHASSVLKSLDKKDIFLFE